jgi:hypothetical protein
LYTYTAAGEHIGTVTKTITCTIPVEVKPSCTIKWEDPTGAAGIYGSPVQGISKLKITVTAQTSYSSGITYRTITANGESFNTAEATTAVLADAGETKIAATVKDRRGRTGSNSVTLDVLGYAPPAITKLRVHRCDPDGTENDQGDCIEVKFTAAITDLVGKNPARYKLRYKDSDAELYTEVELTDLNDVFTVTDYAHIFEADGNSSFDVEIEATDNHGTATRMTSASTAFTLLNWNKEGNGMGVGKVSERQKAVEFALDLYDKNGDPILGGMTLLNLFLPVGSMVLRYDTIDPGTLYPGTTWTQITARILRAGSAGSIGTEGAIADGSGRTYVDIAVWRRTA